MLHTSPWLKYTTLLVLVLGVLFALPNALPQKALDHFPSWLPSHKVNLGLDLQGGSSLTYEVDMLQVQKAKADDLMINVRTALRKAVIPTDGLVAKDGTVQLRVTDMSRYAQAKSALQDINPTLTGSLTREYEVSEPGNGVLVLRPSEAFSTQTRRQILEEEVDVVNRRVNALGTREPSIAPEGDSRIQVDVPGLSDPTQLKALVGKTAKMKFQLVDENADPNARVAPVGDEILPMLDEKAPKGAPPQMVVVHRRVFVEGERLQDASAGFNSRTNLPAIELRFDSLGARQFGDVTKANVGKPFATILDDKVIQVANINEPILTGAAEISGSFTTEYANNIALLMRSGSLPAALIPIQERTVGAELGSDSITAGSWCAVAGLVLVGLFMVLRYGLFGLFADLALTANLVLLLAILTPFATLTLPGIAGIVLTMGMAVDANVLIYERIREEQRGGRGMLAAIDTGFKRAMATIVDANATHLIAALVLFGLGEGPVKGFAVALGFGITTSFFTSVVVTRLIVVTWLNAVRPRALTI